MTWWLRLRSSDSMSTPSAGSGPASPSTKSSPSLPLPLAAAFFALEPLPRDTSWPKLPAAAAFAEAGAAPAAPPAAAAPAAPGAAVIILTASTRDFCRFLSFLRAQWPRQSAWMRTALMSLPTICLSTTHQFFASSGVEPSSCIVRPVTTLRSKRLPPCLSGKCRTARKVSKRTFLITFSTLSCVPVQKKSAP